MYRPGGLTALAIFNFVLSGLSLLLRLLPVLFLLGATEMPDGQPKPAGSFLGITALYLAVDCGLMIVAGIGYLKMKRVMGRYLGTGEALLSLAYFAYAVGFHLSQDIPFSFSQLRSLVYPGLTIVLLNVVFRENLEN